MAGQLSAVEHSDFSGGINAVASPYKVGRTQIMRANNIILDEDGSLTTRDGATTVEQGPAGIAALLALHDLIRADQSLTPLAIGARQLWNRSTSPWTSLGTFGTSYTTPSILSWFNLAIIAAGYETPWVSDGLVRGVFRQINGGALTTPGAPTVTPIGATGSTAYTYVIVALNNSGHSAASSGGSITNGNATLLSNNYNSLTWTAVPNAVSYDVYRSIGGPTQGKLANVATTAYQDMGANGVGTAPTTNTSGSVTPGAKWLALHQNALWAWNTAASTSASDGPSSLRMSDINNFDSWPPGFQLFVNRDDGEHGTGIGIFSTAEAGISPTNTLILFKEYSTYQVTGVFTPTTLPTITKAQTDLGCLAGNTVQFIPGLGLMRLTHRGFAVFNGLTDTLVSEPIRPYLFGKDDISAIAWPNVAISSACTCQNPPLYICACPLDGANTTTRVFVFDLIRKVWTLCTFAVPYATLQLQTGTNIQPHVLAGVNLGSTIYELFNHAENDDGVLVPWSVRFPPYAGLLRRAYLRRCLLRLYHVRPRQQIDAVFVIGPAASPQVLHKSAILAVGANEVAGAPPQRLLEADAVYDVGRIGEGAVVEFSGAGRMSIRGVAYHLRAKPLTRPTQF